VLTDDDLADLPLPTAHSIEVVNFAPAEQLDTILANRAYYTEPEPAGVRAYALLRDALERSGKVAIARVALRQRESLASLRTRDGVMVLETLLWPDEIRAADFDFLDQDVEVRSQELKMASSLIDSMTVDFDPSIYRDGYREALEELVAAKVQGHEVVRPELKVEEGGGSLADALKASLAAAKAGSAGATDGNGKRQARGKASA
jgi:DNA end-binding protein Ku